MKNIKSKTVCPSPKKKFKINESCQTITCGKNEPHFSAKVGMNLFFSFSK